MLREHGRGGLSGPRFTNRSTLRAPLAEASQEEGQFVSGNVAVSPARVVDSSAVKVSGEDGIGIREHGQGSGTYA